MKQLVQKQPSRTVRSNVRRLAPRKDWAQLGVSPGGDPQAHPRRSAADGGSLENDADLDRVPRDVGGSALCGVGDTLGERGVTVISKRSCRSVYADSFELLAHGVGDGNLATIGEHDRRAVRRVQREKLQPWLDLRHFREQRGTSSERIAFT
jgi:hypothetical protein